MQQSLISMASRVMAYFRARPKLRFLSGLGIVLAPLLLLVTLLLRWAVNVPFWDQWELVPIFQHYQDHSLTFADLFAQHNEHRLLVPELVWLALAQLTHWNVTVEVAANIVAATAGFTLLWLLIRATFATKTMRAIALSVISLVFFSALQYENWEWGWQLEWFLSNVGVLLAIWAAGVWRVAPWLRLTVAAAGALLATYSLADGQLAWFICLPLFWFQKELRRLLPVWILAGVAGIGSYYIGYHFNTTSSTFAFMQDPLGAIVYFLAYIARPIVPDFLLSVPIAVLYLTAFVLVVRYWFIRQKRALTGVLLPWLCLGGLAVIAAIITDVGRFSLGVEQAYSSRYTTISSLLLITALVLVLKLLESLSQTLHATGRRIVWAGLIVTMLLVANNYIYGIGQMRQQHAYLLKVQQCARTAQNENDDCLFTLYPDKKVVWRRLQYLRSVHWGGL